MGRSEGWIHDEGIDQCVYLCIADCNGCPVSADIERKTDCEIGDRCSTDSYRTGYFTEEK